MNPVYKTSLALTFRRIILLRFVWRWGLPDLLLAGPPEHRPPKLAPDQDTSDYIKPHLI